MIHWDDVEPQRRDLGHLHGEWTDLGRAAGSVGVGVRRVRLAPGEVPTPAHVHGADEEIFFVIAGSGLSWQDGETYEVRARDCLVHLPLGKAHTLRAGHEGLDVLAYGHRTRIGGGYLPNAGIYWLFPAWAEAGGGAHPFEREPEIDWPAPSPRPPNIVNVDEVEAETWEDRDSGSTVHALGAAAGSVRTGFHYEVVPPGKLNAPPHMHSAEEEIFVVLDGEGTLLLADEEHKLCRGHVVAFPPGKRVAHTFRADDKLLTLLVYGTREPNDICYYPRSNTFSLRGIGLIGRVAKLSWDAVW